MRDFTLTSIESQELRALHKFAKCDKNVHLAYKINAIILLGEGLSLEEVSEVLLFDIETLRSYVEKYRQGGFEELVVTHYKGSTSKLRSAQQVQLCLELDSQIYLTTKQVCVRCTSI